MKMATIDDHRDTLVDEVKGGLVKNDTWGRLTP